MDGGGHEKGMEADLSLPMMVDPVASVEAGEVGLPRFMSDK